MNKDISFTKSSSFWKQTKRCKLVSPTLLQDDGGISDNAAMRENRQTKRSCASSVEKSKSLKEEGIFLAENNNLNEAIMRWSEAIAITPNDERLFEMQSQVFMLMEKDFQAAQQAEKATQLKKNWWIGWQTLGRAQMNLGHIQLAVKNFSRALHLNPLDNSLRKADLADAVKRWNSLTKEALR
uniref:Tetratricopeptide repeat protein 33 n=1 Tax=Phallusia mammillata TaxID=59560 RepID=A0A6F9DW31_9ASCI|nr:tetratricopeptide repeat protein 33 [Phallusia mammillata]